MPGSSATSHSTRCCKQRSMRKETRTRSSRTLQRARSTLRPKFHEEVTTKNTKGTTNGAPDIGAPSLFLCLLRVLRVLRGRFPFRAAKDQLQRMELYTLGNRWPHC